MTLIELVHLEKVLKKIVQQEAGEVKLAIAYVQKDLALRKVQQDRQRENAYTDFGGDFR